MCIDIISGRQFGWLLAALVRQLLRLQQQLFPGGSHMAAAAVIQMLAQLLLLVLLLLQLLLMAAAEARAARAAVAAIAGHAVGILVWYGYARAVLDVHNRTLHCKEQGECHRFCKMSSLNSQ